MGSLESETYSLVMDQRITFRQPIARRPTMPSTERVETNFLVISEEWAELVGALYGQWAGEVAQKVVEGVALGNRRNQSGGVLPEPDLVLTADALGDLVITIYGMAIEMGIDLDKIIKEQMRANMSKVDDDGNPVFNDAGKYVKDGTNYSPPDVVSVLREQGWGM